MEQGQKVTIKNTLPATWFNSYPATLDGEVVKVFKNGKVSIRMFDTVVSRKNKVFHFETVELA